MVGLDLGPTTPFDANEPDLCDFRIVGETRSGQVANQSSARSSLAVVVNCDGLVLRPVVLVLVTARLIWLVPAAYLVTVTDSHCTLFCFYYSISDL